MQQIQTVTAKIDTLYLHNFWSFIATSFDANRHLDFPMMLWETILTNQKLILNLINQWKAGPS